MPRLGREWCRPLAVPKSQQPDSACPRTFAGQLPFRVGPTAIDLVLDSTLCMAGGANVSGSSWHNHPITRSLLHTTKRFVRFGDAAVLVTSLAPSHCWLVHARSLQVWMSTIAGSGSRLYPEKDRVERIPGGASRRAQNLS